MKDFIVFLLDRCPIERTKSDRLVIYAHTQYLLAYISNKIEGSTLMEKQTVSGFTNGTLHQSDDYYRAKDLE